MRELKIGNLLISKKGIVILAFLFFLSGVVFGGTIMANQLRGTNMFFIFLPVLSIIWSVYIPSLEKEIKEFKR